MTIEDREKFIRQRMQRKAQIKKLYKSPEWYASLEEAKSTGEFWTDEANSTLRDFTESTVANSRKYRLNDGDDVFYVIDFENNFNITGSDKESILRFSVGMPEEYTQEQIEQIRSNLIASGSLSAAVCV